MKSNNSGFKWIYIAPNIFTKLTAPRHTFIDFINVGFRKPAQLLQYLDLHMKQLICFSSVIPLFSCNVYNYPWKFRRQRWKWANRISHWNLFLSYEFSEKKYSLKYFYLQFRTDTIGLYNILNFNLWLKKIYIIKFWLKNYTYIELLKTY